MEEEHLSYSQISQWLGCQRQFWFQRIEQAEPMDVSSSLIIGSAYHSAVEMYYKAKLKGESDVKHNEMIAVFEQILLEEEADKIINYGRSSRDAEITKADGVFKAFLDGQEESEVVDVEKMFRLDLEGLPPIIGRIDLIERTKEGLVIVDLKTSASKPSRSSDSHVPDDIDGSHQMTLYQIWAEQEFPDEKIGLRMDYMIKSVKNPTFLKLKTQRNQQDKDRLCSIIKSVYGQIQMARAQVIEALPMRSFRCNGCGYRAICNQESSIAA